MKNKIPAAAALILILTLLAASCPGTTEEPDYISERRTIYVDVPNMIFESSQNSVKSQRGLGVSGLELVLSAGDEPQTKTLSRPSGYDKYKFSQIVFENVSGVLSDLSVEVKIGAAALVSQWTGSSPFQEELKFLVNFTVGEDSDPGSITLGPGLSPGSYLIYDTGEFRGKSMDTYRARTEMVKSNGLQSRQVFLQPHWAEHENGLEYDLYILQLGENLADMYYAADDAYADYRTQSYTWSPNWTLEEIVSTGRLIGGEYRNDRFVPDKTPYILERVREKIDPIHTGGNGYLYTLDENLDLPQYLLAAMVVRVKGGTREVPSRVELIEIK